VAVSLEGLACALKWAHTFPDKLDRSAYVSKNQILEINPTKIQRLLAVAFFVGKHIVAILVQHIHRRHSVVYYQALLRIFSEGFLLPQPHSETDIAQISFPEVLSNFAFGFVLIRKS